MKICINKSKHGVCLSIYLTNRAGAGAGRCFQLQTNRAGAGQTPTRCFQLQIVQGQGRADTHPLFSVTDSAGAGQGRHPPAVFNYRQCRGRAGQGGKGRAGRPGKKTWEILGYGFQDLGSQLWGLGNFRIWFSRHGFQDLGSQLWGLNFHTRGFQDRNLKTFKT